MKKVFYLIIIFTIIIFMSGCNINLSKEKVTKCILKNDQSKNNYKTKTTYKIYSKKDIVSKVSYEEVLISKNTTIIKYFENINKKQFEKQNKLYGGYTYDVKSEKNTVTSNVTIDYSKIDMKKFIDDNSSIKSYINKDNKMTLKGAKAMYKSLGAKCK